jgi:hypothetical protein
LAFILIKDGAQESVAAFIMEAWKKYRTYLAEVAEQMPQSARDFALAEWHHNFNDPRAPHDAWVEQVLVYESATGDRHEVRQCHIKLRLLGAYHDGHIEIEYTDVNRYSLGSEYSSHGDWRFDEIRLSNSGNVLHEIEIGDTTWIIECKDIRYSWLPMEEKK